MDIVQRQEDHERRRDRLLIRRGLLADQTCPGNTSKLSGHVRTWPRPHKQGVAVFKHKSNLILSGKHTTSSGRTAGELRLNNRPSRGLGIN